jgi:hypothetical protein
MDGLSSGASVLAVVSIAVQLADNVKRIYDFWSSVKSAPDSICAVTNDLNLLLGVLSDAAASEEAFGRSKATEGVLLSCSCYPRSEILTLIDSDLQVRVESTICWKLRRALNVDSHLVAGALASGLL